MARKRSNREDCPICRTHGNRTTFDKFDIFFGRVPTRMLTGGALQMRKEFRAWSGGSYRSRNPCCNLVGQTFATDRKPYGCFPNSMCNPSFPSCHLHEDEELHSVVSLHFACNGLVRLRGGALRAHVVKRGRSASTPPPVLGVVRSRRTCSFGWAPPRTVVVQDPSARTSGRIHIW